MEEQVGMFWHRFITKKANKHYPEAKITLDDMRHTAGIFFRALGGEGGLQVESATDSEVHARRTLLQRIAGTGKKTQYAWRDDETLRLPESIAIFPSKELNRDLYLWLTAISVVDDSDSQSDSRNDSRNKSWISRNQQCTQKTLDIWPGLAHKYQKLLAAHLQLRPDPDKLPQAEAQQERAIRRALADSQAEITLEYAKRPPQPVPLWLHPSPPKQEASQIKQQDVDIIDRGDEDDDAQDSGQSKKVRRKQANREDMPKGDDGLMSFRLESLWSWSEYVKVDRSSIEDSDDDVARTADDMDQITLSQDSETTASKIRLDLDLPSTQYDDIVLGEGIPVDEWDYKQQRLQRDHCRIIPMLAREAEAMSLPPKLRSQARKIRRHFEMLRPQRHWVSRQNDGTELDLESYINFLADRKHGQIRSDVPIYRELRNKTRDLSCLLLADISLSSDAHINDESRVIDVIRDSLYLFSEALSATGDRFALYGFSSRNRNHVRFHNIKTFDDHYNDNIRGHINAIKPGYYTRMGTAIRHASKLLSAEPSSKKLLLIITDGKPNDLDKYEGRYGIEDTRHAIIEAEKMGLQPFCVTIDEQAEDYLPYLFGQRSFVVVKNAEELPRKLPLLYIRLTN